MKKLLSGLIILPALCLLFIPRAVSAQMTVIGEETALWTEPEAAEAAAGEDSASILYREAYSDIMKERWEGAREKFRMILKRFPRSPLADDAGYWSAYAIGNIDPSGGAREYEKFISANRGSRYYPDAVADLSELRKMAARAPRPDAGERSVRIYVKENGSGGSEGMSKIDISVERIIIGDGPESLIVGKGKVTIRSDGNSYSYNYSPEMKSIEPVLKLHSRRITRLSSLKDGDEGDAREIELIIDSSGGEDEENFRKLRMIVYDHKNPVDLREAALVNLSGFRKINVVPLFLDVARNDTSEDIQKMVVELLSQRRGDRGNKVKALIDLYRNLRHDRASQRQRIFYKIAENGGDEAVDFLEDVALTGRDDDLRDQAIYYLGSIGSPKARAALLRIPSAK